MKKIMKILTILLIVTTLISFSANVYASGDPLNPSNLKATYGDASVLQNKAGQIMGGIRNAAVIAAVIIIMCLGVKFMLGSVEEKAEYKKTFLPLIIGIVCVVAATSIATFIFNMVD